MACSTAAMIVTPMMPATANPTPSAASTHVGRTSPRSRSEPVPLTRTATTHEPPSPNQSPSVEPSRNAGSVVS